MSSYPETGAAKPPKARAQDMDESLQLTQQMKEHIEKLTARQGEALAKMKDSKGAVKKLREQVQSMQQQIDNVQNETTSSGKATEDIRGELAKLEQDHAALSATQSRTKSSLDSALAAQEEYRKGYNSLREAFKKAKEDLEKVNEELTTSKDAQAELKKAYALVDEQKARWTTQLDEVNATLKRIAHKHKDKSKKVLDRMLAGQASGLMGTCYKAWLDFLKDWKNSEKAKAEVAAAQAKIQGFQNKKNEEAKQFLNRMSAASDSGLVSMTFKAWLTAIADGLKERREADKMASTFKNQKLEARKRLEATLGANMKGLQGLVFKNWSQNFKEEKEERLLNAQADAVMKDYMKKKRGESMQVVGRMAQKKENALLSQMVLLWKIVISSEVAAKYREKEARQRLETVGAEIEEAKKVYAARKEVLDDAQEELVEVQKKNKMMREQLQAVIDLEDSMENAQKELEKDDD